jgi:thioredoxin reductase (NADPH)
MTTHPLVDITILGAGPTGLFASFYAGMRGVTAQLVDALPQVGGQLMALYPEKFIFDVAGFPQVLAKDLVTGLDAQAKRWDFPRHLGQNITGLEEADGHFVLTSETDRFPTRAIVIAAGIGAFSPRRLPQACAEPWYGKGIDDVVLDPTRYHGKRVVIIGGGDTAFDWADQLAGKAAHVTLAHRTDRFRAHGATVDSVNAHAEAGRVTMRTWHELAEVHDASGTLCGITLQHVKSKETVRVDCDAVLPMLGFVSNMGAIASWGLDITNDEIAVNQQMETGRPGIWAAGDVTTYPGKMKLIAVGFAEAATAVNQAVHWIYPDKKVTPGHSSNLAIFGQKPD